MALERRHKSVEELLEKLIELQQEQSTYTLESLSVQRDTEQGVQDALELLREIFAELVPSQAQSLTITFSNSKGNDMASTITLQVGQTTQATAHEFSGLAGAGVELPLAGAISWASSDPTVASVDANGLVTGVGPGQANITGTDAANGLSGAGVVSDTPVVAQSLTVDFAPAV